jgi:hypothetical protein
LAGKGGDAMNVGDIIGAVASVITIFTAGFAVGSFISKNNKNDRR